MPLYFPRALDQSSASARRKGLPHITGKEFLARFGTAPGSSAAYALTSEDFEALAKTYAGDHRRPRSGRDRDRRGIRAERGDKVALLDGGDTWQGSVVTEDARAGHDRLHGPAQARCDDRALGIHLWHGARQAGDRGIGLSPFPGLNIRDTE